MWVRFQLLRRILWEENQWKQRSYCTAEASQPVFTDILFTMVKSIFAYWVIYVALRVVLSPQSAVP